jgi:hypothetical protein
MNAFIVVRFTVKSGMDESFLDAHRWAPSPSARVAPSVA